MSAKKTLNNHYTCTNIHCVLINIRLSLINIVILSEVVLIPGRVSLRCGCADDS